MTISLLKQRILLALPALLLLLGSSLSHGQWLSDELVWKLKRDRNGIQIFLAKVPDSKFRAVMSTTEITGDLKQVVALVMDLENCPKWASLCKSAKIVERISANEAYVYSVNDAPFPVRDRDMVAHVKWRHDDISGSVIMNSQATPERLPKVKGLIRVQYASSEWRFTPKENGKILVENFAHVDPNGRTPAWLTNLLIVESPYKTLSNMRKLIESGEYSDSEEPFPVNKSSNISVDQGSAQSVD